MKRMCFSLLLLLASLGLKAQVFKIDEFKLAASNGASGIYADYDCNQHCVFFVDMQVSESSPRMQVRLDSKVDEFAKALEKTQKKYLEWSKTAKEKGITSVSKDMTSSFPSLDMFFLDSEHGFWYKVSSKVMRAKFLVSDDGSCYLVLMSGEVSSNEAVFPHLHSEGNTFVDLVGEWEEPYGPQRDFTLQCPGAAWVFSSAEEIAMFADKLRKAKEWKTASVKRGKVLR